MFDCAPLVEYYNKGIFLNYRRKYEEYYNEYTKSRNAYEGIDFISIQLDNKVFDWENSYYDGHTIGTAGDKPEEGGDDVKSSWPL